jgi:hypothetical protein
MNCWHCKTELIWGGDHSMDEEANTDYQEYLEWEAEGNTAEAAD